MAYFMDRYRATLDVRCHVPPDAIERDMVGAEIGVALLDVAVLGLLALPVPCLRLDRITD